MVTHLEDEVAKHEHHHTHKYKGHKMHEPVNVFAGNPMGGGNHDGFGMGGGLIGGLVLGSLLRNGGLGGNGNDSNLGAGQIAYDTAVLSKLGSIEGAIPAAALQTQAAIAASSADITNGTLQQTINIGAQLSSLSLAGQQSFSNVKDAIQNQSAGILTGFSAINQNISAGTYALNSAIRDDGDKTRALIQSIDSANLNRQLTVAENALMELRMNERRAADSHAITIQNTMSQSQNQLQFQQQQQALNGLLGALHVCDQNIRATNQAVNIGSGTQAANPTNNNTNNKVN